jgi:D-amino peptidase
MKVAVFVDMEGISGISSSIFVSPAERCFAEGRRYMTEDANACIRGCFNAGATDVLIYDGHGGSNNIIWDQLDPRAELGQGTGAEERFPLIEEYDALILLGYHAMAGTESGFLEHTYSSKAVQNMWLNGRKAGEFAFDAAIAGEKGIPVIMTSGDDKLCKEAKEWIPEVVTCQTKVGLSCQYAKLLSKEKAHKMIEEKTEEAVKKYKEIPPFKVEGEVTIRRELIERGALPKKPWNPDINFIDGRTIEIKGSSVEETFWKFY